MKKKLTLDEFLEYTLIMLIIAAVALIGNWVSSKFTASFAESLPGILILFGIAFVGTTLARLIPVKIPAVIWITVIGILLAIEGSPWPPRCSPTPASTSARTGPSSRRSAGAASS